MTGGGIAGSRFRQSGILRQFGVFYDAAMDAVASKNALAQEGAALVKHRNTGLRPGFQIVGILDRHAGYVDAVADDDNVLLANALNKPERDGYWKAFKCGTACAPGRVGRGVSFHSFPFVV